MATRSPNHAEEEKAIFEAFLRAHRCFASKVRNVHQPDDEFPDIVAELVNGSEVDFELGEWLDGAQMAEAKRYERLVEAIDNAIGPQAPNSSQYARYFILQAAESHLTPTLFRQILGRVERRAAGEGCL